MVCVCVQLFMCVLMSMWWILIRPFESVILEYHLFRWDGISQWFTPCVCVCVCVFKDQSGLTCQRIQMDTWLKCINPDYDTCTYAFMCRAQQWSHKFAVALGFILQVFFPHLFSLQAFQKHILSKIQSSEMNHSNKNIDLKKTGKKDKETRLCTWWRPTLGKNGKSIKARIAIHHTTNACISLKYKIQYIWHWFTRY